MDAIWRKQLPEMLVFAVITVLSGGCSAQAVRRAAMFLVAASLSSYALAQVREPADTHVLEVIREAAVSSRWSWDELQTLTDSIGPRLSGSRQLDAAIRQLADKLRALGAQVRLQPVKVPHWVRGEEHAELTEYAGRPSGMAQTLHLTALGGSSSTPPNGLEGRVVIVRDIDELKLRASEVRGALVLFNVPFDQGLAENGLALNAYEQAVRFRNSGPAEAAALGASAALVRSVGGAEYRLPHTGSTDWKEHQAPIPAAAVSAEDADLLTRLAARGPVRMKLVIGAQQLQDADSFNVIADWPGTEFPDEVVVVSGHLDSWDLGTGATDDGVGVAAAAGVIEVLQHLNLHARRTVRFIAWTDNEIKSSGAEAYARARETTVAKHCAAIEDDLGAGRALGFYAAATHGVMPSLGVVARVLAPMGATAIARSDGTVGDDIGPLQVAGVPGFALLTDHRHLFDYHHTAADTLDKVVPADLGSHVATMAVLAYFLADRPDCLPRFPIDVAR